MPPSEMVVTDFYNFSNFPRHEANVHKSKYKLSNYIEPILTLYFACFIIKIYKKARYNLEPIHILALNIFSDLVAQSGVKSVENAFFIVTSSCETFFCKFSYLLQYFCLFSFYSDIILEQADGFLAIYWNVKYKTRVTCTRVAKIIFVTKLILFVIAGLVILLDKEATRCKNLDSIACEYLRKNNVFYSTIPMFLTTFIIIIVSVYFIIVNCKISSRVSPTNIQLNYLEAAQHQQQQQQQQLQQQSSSGSSQHGEKDTDAKKYDDDLVLEDLEIIQPAPSAVISIIQEDKSIQRQNPDPYMFYRVKEGPEKPEIEQEQHSHRLEKQVSSMPLNQQQQEPRLAKEVMKINLVTFFHILILLPINIFNMIFYLNDDYKCESFTVEFKIFGYVQLFFVTLYPFLILAKLKMI